MKNKKLRIFSVSISLLLALLVVFFSGVLISRNINYKKSGYEKLLDYKVSNDVNYKIEVDEGYDKEVNNVNIISSIIDNIKLDFNYNLDINEEVNTRTSYTITSKLVINQLKDVTITSLVDEENVLVKNDVINTNFINESITSDYNYYYDYFKNYKAKYPISGLDAKIVYTFKVNTRGVYNGGLLDDTSESYISISLSDTITSIKKNGINNMSRELSVEKELPLINKERENNDQCK